MPTDARSSRRDSCSLGRCGAAGTLKRADFDGGEAVTNGVVIMDRRGKVREGWFGKFERRPEGRVWKIWRRPEGRVRKIWKRPEARVREIWRRPEARVREI